MWSVILFSRCSRHRETNVIIWARSHRRWFFGFQKVDYFLQQTKPGSFLFRFSSTPGSYALSTSTESGVVHWRIKCDKEDTYPPILTIDQRKYKSFGEIFRIHSREPLPIKDSSGRFVSSVLLLEACNRDTQIVY